MVSDAQEQGFYRQVLDSLGTWLGKVRTLVLAGFDRVGTPPNPSAMYAATPLWLKLVDAMIVTLKSDMTQDASAYVTDVAKSTWLQYQLDTTRNLLVRIPDEVYGLIVEQINESRSAGENQAQLAARIDQVLSVTDSERWPNRARLIAVTETHRASNLAIQAAGQILQNSQNEPILKQWDALSDDRVRTSHVEVDGDIVGIAHTFTVGGFQMMCPGDPSAPADEVCNCRCSLKLLGVN